MASQSHAEFLTESQEVLARTAQSFVDELAGADDMLAANPKLAGSNFMALIRGLGQRDVVVEDGPVTTSGDEVSEGAKFVQRSTGGADWAGNFLGESSTEASQVSLAGVPSTSNGLASGSFAKQNPVVPADRWHVMDSWQRQFDGQQNITMVEQRPTLDLVGQRRKSVHFDDALGTGVPSSLEEASNARTSIPHASSDWEEDDLDAFDHDTFMAYNGEMRKTQSPRIGVGALEGWGGMQQDWDDFQRSEPGSARSRGMRMGDSVERYPFQSGNPYTSGVVDVENYGRQSSTFKVSYQLLR